MKCLSKLLSKVVDEEMEILLSSNVEVGSEMKRKFKSDLIKDRGLYPPLGNG